MESATREASAPVTGPLEMEDMKIHDQPRYSNHMWWVAAVVSLTDTYCNSIDTVSKT